MMNSVTQSKNMVAKLLANEDLRVVRAPVKTASFNVKDRVLTLPMWKNMSTNVEDMLIGHEVGHALFTPMAYHETKDMELLFEYMNVIEDVRIEKAMKRKYPGMRSSFTAGYNELREKDFFGISNRDLTNSLLIDRINLYYKCGYNCGVKFTPAEMEFVRKTDQCKTIEDVRTLARDIFEYSKGEWEKNKEEKQSAMEEIREELQKEFEEGFELDEDFDFDEDSSSIQSQSQRQDSPEFEEEEDYSNDPNEMGESSELSDELQEETEEEALKPKTQTIFDERLKELSDTESQFKYFDLDYKTFNVSDDVLVGYNRIIEELTHDCQEQTMRPHLYHEFKRENARIINYLIKEFEMRKAATEYQRSFDSPTGRLDSRKLATYKLNPDIFKKITEVAEGQKHGMVMLVDWSGSMFNCIDDVLKQAIILASFCRQAEIPFRVFAFSNGYPSKRVDISDEVKASFEDDNSWNMDHMHLFELLSSKMSNKEFTKMCELLLDAPYARSRRYQMYSTPLNEALVYLADYIGTFMKEHSVEKMSFITLTDGEGHAISYGQFGQRLRAYNREYINGEFKAGRVHNYIEDPITKKTYSITDSGEEQTSTFLKIIKDRYGCKLIGFYVGGTGAREINQFLRTNCGLDYSQAYMKVNDVRSEGRKNGVAICPPGVRDKMYFVPQNKLKIEDEQLVASPQMTVHQLARSFGKHLKIQKTNRVLLNNFIGEIA